MATVTSREFNQQPSKIKRMAQDGPVFVTDRGEDSLVVMTAEEYRSLHGRTSVYDSLQPTDPAAREIDFEPLVSREIWDIPEL